MIDSGIYAIINTENNKVYIGQSKHLRNRANSHFRELAQNKHINSHLQYAYNKYGKDSFKFEILVRCKESELDEKEIFFINLFKSCDQEYGYNIEGGGNRKKFIPKSTREKLSEAAKGEKNGFFGKHHTETTKKQMKEYRKLHPLSDDSRAKIGKANSGNIEAAIQDYLKGMSNYEAATRNGVSKSTLSLRLKSMGVYRGRGRSPLFMRKIEKKNAETKKRKQELLLKKQIAAKHMKQAKKNQIINEKLVQKQKEYEKLLSIYEPAIEAYVENRLSIAETSRIFGVSNIKLAKILKERNLFRTPDSRMEEAIELYKTGKMTIEKISQKLHINETRLSKELKNRGLHKGWIMLDKSKVWGNHK